MRHQSPRGTTSLLFAECLRLVAARSCLIACAHSSSGRGGQNPRQLSKYHHTLARTSMRKTDKNLLFVRPHALSAALVKSGLLTSVGPCPPNPFSKSGSPSPNSPWRAFWSGTRTRARFLTPLANGGAQNPSSSRVPSSLPHCLRLRTIPSDGRREPPRMKMQFDNRYQLIPCCLREADR